MQARQGFVLLLALCPALLWAGQIHRCVSPKGNVSYQVQPCQQGLRLDHVIDYQPVPDSPPMQAASTSSKPPAPSSGRTRKAKTSSRRIVTDNERCRLAREQREQASKKLGLRRSYRQMVKLDEPVHAACRW